MRATLFEVFGERDPQKRAAAIARTYADDVVFSDPDDVVTGHAALDAKAQAILDGAPDFVFAESGPAYSVQDLSYQAWVFGPAGADPVVRGVDIGFVENGRIAKLYTLLLS